ncbi:TIGR02678 family protein [Streptomyces sp. MZ04]|uniref:TIGR02678 family protein n=1 Tax=Streptomyces sp. MZ04 TaxID=2559236 RepID=UPI00107EADBA|nr:TIGR02678 family protein [Streptomyces sp. MZ04]TGB05615.1 TIGR02678 family protein [Streptomyces sp. MZ04]
MTTPLTAVLDSRRTADFQQAGRALLKEPLLLAHGPHADDFRLVRQYTSELRDWFERNTGWSLQVDAEAARLRKSPGTLTDPTHPAREVKRADTPFTRRRYVLLCLALAALERSEAQITLGRLAEQVMLDAAEPRLAATGITFTLERRDERIDLAAVVRLLLHLGVVRRVAGEEEAYVSGTGDVLYDVERRVLAGLLASRRGPSIVIADAFEARLAELSAESALDSEELRFRAIRWTLTRRLLDEPVLYYDELSDAELAYLTRQRSFIAARINELTGLVPEVRAEGIAMIDPRDDLTDVRMPEQGTHGHVTLLLAEHLAAADSEVSREALEQRVRELAARHGSYWSKAAKQPGAEAELVEQAVARLCALGLARRTPDGVAPRPALHRYAVGEAIVLEPAVRAAASGPARPAAPVPTHRKGSQQ